MTAELADLLKQLDEDASHNIGFPTSMEPVPGFDELLPLLLRPLNNVGDPFGPESAYPRNVHHLERDVIYWLARQWRLNPHDVWGYVTGGSTLAIEWAVIAAVARLGRRIRVYYSAAAHDCVEAIVTRLGLRGVVVKTDLHGRMDVNDLESVLQRGMPALVIATAGTTMTEAVDPVGLIRAVCEQTTTRFHIHVDAAHSGIGLSMLDADLRVPFDFVDGADSMSTSFSKGVIGTPWPAAAIVTTKHVRNALQPRVATYTGVLNTTLENSRSGHSVLAAWHALTTLGVSGIRQRVDRCLHLAEYAAERLRDIGVTVHRYPHATTVAFTRPSQAVCRMWSLPEHDGIAHVVITPSVTQQQIDKFVCDVAAGYPNLDEEAP